MSLEPEINLTSIVIIGHFNPLIFRPEWFAKKGILTEKEAESAQIGVIHPDMVMFGIEPWLKFSVDPNKLSVSILQEPLIKGYDFIIGCLANSPESPISQMGINREMHFALETEKKWHALGDLLAPKKPWGEFAIGSKGKRKGGLLSLSMQQKPRDDEFTGHIIARVSPSNSIKCGVCCHINDHYDFAEGDSLKDGKWAIDHLKKQWELSIEQSGMIINNIVSQV